jgi:hypothetical protein
MTLLLFAMRAGLAGLIDRGRPLFLLERAYPYPSTEVGLGFFSGALLADVDVDVDVGCSIDISFGAWPWPSTSVDADACSCIPRGASPPPFNELLVSNDATLTTE